MRVVQIRVYWLVVGIATTLVSPVLAVLASVQIAEANARQIIAQQQQQAAEQRAAARVAYCDLVRTYVELYEETPPSTPAGKNAQQTWLGEYRRQGCQPPK